METPLSPHPLQLLGSRGGSDSGRASLAPSPPLPPLPPPLAPSHVVCDGMAALMPEPAHAMATALQPPWR